jgi:hypothetical protein
MNKYPQKTHKFEKSYNPRLTFPIKGLFLKIIKLHFFYNLS